MVEQGYNLQYQEQTAIMVVVAVADTTAVHSAARAALRPAEALAEGMALARAGQARLIPERVPVRAQMDQHPELAALAS